MKSKEEFEALVFEKAAQLEKEQAKRRHKKLLLRKYSVLFIVIFSISAFCTVIYKRNTYCGIILPDGTIPEYNTEAYVVSYAEPMNGTAAYGETDDHAEYDNFIQDNNNNNNNNDSDNNVQSAIDMGKEENDYQPKYAHDPAPRIIYLNHNDEICAVQSAQDIQNAVKDCEALPWQITEEIPPEDKEIPDFEFTVRYYSQIEEEIYCKEYFIDIYNNRVYKSPTDTTFAASAPPPSISATWRRGRQASSLNAVCVPGIMRPAR